MQMRMLAVLLFGLFGLHALAADITLEGNDQMQFNLKTFDVKAGETVKLTLKHTGKLPVAAMGHNVVVLKTGVDAMQFGMGVSGKGGNAGNGYIPTDAAEKAKIIAHTKLVGGGESVTIEFKAPAAGSYPYVCTFPGHVAMMRGVMNVK